jgi:integrase
VISERGIGTYRQEHPRERRVTTANVRRKLRKVLGDAGIEGVSPHVFRRTVATVINEQVNPLTAELLDQAFAREDGGGTL